MQLLAPRRRLCKINQDEQGKKMLLSAIGPRQRQELIRLATCGVGQKNDSRKQ
jgi:hypothetical protein